MSTRITKSILFNALERLNSIARGRYRLDGAYGGWKLMTENYRDISIRGSKREIYWIIQAIINTLLEEREYE